MAMGLLTAVTALSLLRLVEGQYKEGEILTSKKSLCRTNYYNWPECIDSPTGYQCRCGAGFYWNTRICISDAVDSRLEFPAAAVDSSDKREFAYALLLNKPFPLLEELTMSLYMKPSPKESTRRQCIFSYKYRYQAQDFIFSLFIGTEIELTVHNLTARAKVAKHLDTSWTQLAVTWTSLTGEVSVYFNKTKLRLEGGIVLLAQQQHIESNGHMVLGQYSPDNNNIYNLSLAYEGNLAHFNIWTTMFSDEEMDVLQSDCTFTHCGDGVEWVDLREGTRGTARLRWPSGIDYNQHCFSSGKATETCDKYCSFVIGVQCKQETRESVVWARTKAEPDDASLAIVKMRCPGFHTADNSTPVPMANRSCKSNADKVGVWGEPQMDNCLSHKFLKLSRKVKSFERNSGRVLDKGYYRQLLSLLTNHTRDTSYNNPVDLSVTISSLSILLRLQRAEVERLLDRLLGSLPSTYYMEDDHDKILEYNETIALVNMHLSALNNLMDRRHDYGWNKTLPLGQEADELLQFVGEFLHVVALSLRYHKLSGEAVDPLYRRSLENIALKVQAVNRENFFGVVFPDTSDLSALDMAYEPAVIYYDSGDTIENPVSSGEDICVSAVRLNTFSRLLYDPKHPREDSINAPIISIRVYAPANNTFTISNISVNMVLSYTNSFNISNPSCVSVTHGNSSINKEWYRDSSTCVLIANTSESVTCQCEGDLFFTATTDMYNENWEIEDEDPVLMSVPSYLGCCLSLLLCICTLAMLAYVGTSSRTAVMHKHYAVAVVCNTSVFMVGITQTSNEIICRSFAVLFHYFFLAMFSWLMNEGFNVYISITYTAHNQNTQENSGLWRYYIIGWGVPAVLVSAIVGASFDNYFSEDMCFVSWQSVWLFLGPPLALICVTLLVMIFAAKENNEVSYTKNESANAMTEYHANAVWTQLILLTCTWSIAFLSLKFESIVFKWVFFIFNTAQGAFLFVFFFLLNEEVRSVFKTKEIRQQLGWGSSSSSNEDEAESALPLTSTGATMVNVIDGDGNIDDTIQHMRPDQLDTLTETSV